MLKEGVTNIEKTFIRISYEVIMQQNTALVNADWHLISIWDGLKPSMISKKDYVFIVGFQ